MCTGAMGYGSDTACQHQGSGDPHVNSKTSSYSKSHHRNKPPATTARATAGVEPPAIARANRLQLTDILSKAGKPLNFIIKT